MEIDEDSATHGGIFSHPLERHDGAKHAVSSHECSQNLGEMRQYARARASLLLRLRDACAAPASLLATVAFHPHPAALQACCGCMALLAHACRTRMWHLNGPASVLLARMVWLLPMRQAHRQ